MFYNTSLMNSNTLGIVWCYANRQRTVNDNATLPKICSTIEKWVNHDGTQRGRLSLRTSTLLVNGTARLYKEELDKLYTDCIQLDKRMLYRRSLNTSVTDDNHSSTPEREHSRNTTNNNKRRRNRKRHRRSKNNSQRSPAEDRWISEGSIRDVKSFETNSTNSDLHDVSLPKTSDAEVQTTKSYIANMREQYSTTRNDVNFNANLPMGLIMVYNDISRLPSKIIYANINKDVRLL
ncbi:uncharacterized protein LOC125072082 [Vanessa atalanta]|uniref:uncharacterized protein LOC125072082 n=1 Tax=Vanessa atalanta TaxID=42275 RepID=UPI001FCD1810|nr:uncharacterized protein LOC125072082 [Vanessa atalanta]